MNITTPITTIVTHDNCPDGIASAMILRDVFPFAKVLWMQHGTKELAELPATPGMIFCDIVPPAARVDQFLEAGAYVLDHHKTARDVVLPFVATGRGVFADEAAEPGVCGAVLAFREVWEPGHGIVGRASPLTQPTLDRTEFFVTLAGIRDTWQRNSPHWQDACAQAAVLLFRPKDEWRLENIIGWKERFGWIGDLLLAKQAESVARAIAVAHRFTTPRGTKVITFMGSSVTSDASDVLGNAVDLVVGFTFKVDQGVQKMDLSTRSPTTFDCAALAKHYGGGGHPPNGRRGVPGAGGSS